LSEGPGFAPGSGLPLELIAPAGARLVVVPALVDRRVGWREVGALPAGTAVVLCDPRPGARARCRRFASRAGLAPGRAYLALPSLRRRLVLVEDGREPLRYACSALLAVPPGTTRLAAPLAAALALLRLPVVWRLLGAVVPGRVVVGWRA
jgi:hypothetical protein